MYKDFYHMREEPFSNRPTPAVFFESQTHKRVWQYLLDAIDSEESIVLVLGDYGMGKTTLFLRLVQIWKELRRSSPSLPPGAELGGFTSQTPTKIDKSTGVFFPTPDYSFAQMLNKVASALGIPQSASEMEAQERIHEYFERENHRKSLFIVIDDAGELDLETLAKLRFLTDFVHDGFYPFHVILFAHTTLMEKLKNPRLLPLLQRTKRRYHLEHLDLDETREYIYFRLYKSGSPGLPSFSDDAVRLIYQYSDGVPRLIHNLCDNCLLVGGSEKLTQIGSSVVQSVIRYLEGLEPAAPSDTRTAPAPPPPYTGDSFPLIMIMKHLRFHLDNLWATILLRAPERPRTILLCGADYGEGVTFLSFHLALFLYLEYNLRVLYVSTDPGVRQPYSEDSGTKTFPGLEAYFHQNRPLDSLILKTEFPGLFILPSGDLGKTAKMSTVIAEKESLEKLMDYVSSNFHVTIFDGQPPLRSPGMLGFAKVVDQVVLVCRYAVSRREVSKLALDKLRECGASVLGVILNDRQYPIPARVYKALK